MSLSDQIRMSQISAAEDAVTAHLKELGLITEPESAMSQDNPNGQTQYLVDGELVAISQDNPELCGAWAGDGLCTMPKGHNMRRLDIPSNHKCEKPVAAQEPSERLANKLGMMPTDAWRFNGIEASLVIAALYRHAAPCTRCAELEALYSKLDEHCSAGWDKCDELQAKITEHASSVNYLRLRVEQFDRAISRIGHHLHLTLAGVDTEDEHGPGGHSAEAICRKFDKQAERIKALEEQLEQADTCSKLMDAWIAEHKQQMPWGKAVELIHIVTKMPVEQRDRLLCLDFPDFPAKLAKADAVILQVKDALSESVAYATIYITNFPANQIKALCPRCAELEKQQRILSEDYALLCGKLAETEKTIELVAMELCEENGLDENTDKKILNAIAEYKKGTVWYERNLHVLR